MTLTPEQETSLATARSWLAHAQKVLIVTGSGISAESGIPTFRDPGGLWSGFKAEDLASVTGFERDPCTVWAWYESRRQRVLQASPNVAHTAVAAYARARPGVAIVTQNVDDLHQRAARAIGDHAGTEAIIDLHGSLFRMRCRQCGLQGTMPAIIDATSLESLPHCGSCQGMMRPDIVWFGEALDRKKADAVDFIASHADVCLVIGTSLEVFPAALLPRQVLMHGGSVIQINPKPLLYADSNAIHLVGKAGALVPPVLRMT